MEHTLEQVSPTQKKLTITFTAKEVNAALDKAIMATRKDLALAGFRRGKVPFSVVEKRFGEEVAYRTSEEQVNKAIQEIFEKENIEALSNLTVEDDFIFKRDKEMIVEVLFDVLPDIKLPDYKNFVIEEDTIEVGEEEVQELIDLLCKTTGPLTPLTEDRHPEYGDEVDVNFAAFEDDGTPVAEVQGEHFPITIGSGQVIQDFEDLVVTGKVGQTVVGPTTFPKDYNHKPLAGKTVNMHITINAIQERGMRELDDALAQEMKQPNVEALRQAMHDRVLDGKKQELRRKNMQSILEQLFAGTEVLIPPAMLEDRIQRIVNEKIAASQGEDAARILVDNYEEEKALAMPQAMEALKGQLILMAIANKEGIEVTDEQVQIQAYQLAMQSGQDPQQAAGQLHQSGMMGEIRNQLLASGALTFIYDNAIKEPAKEGEKPKKAAKKTTKKAEAAGKEALEKPMKEAKERISKGKTTKAEEAPAEAKAEAAEKPKPKAKATKAKAAKAEAVEEAEKPKAKATKAKAAPKEAKPKEAKPKEAKAEEAEKPKKAAPKTAKAKKSTKE